MYNKIIQYTCKWSEYFLIISILYHFTIHILLEKEMLLKIKIFFENLSYLNASYNIHDKRWSYSLLSVWNINIAGNVFSRWKWTNEDDEARIIGGPPWSFSGENWVVTNHQPSIGAACPSFWHKVSQHKYQAHYIWVIIEEKIMY